MTIEDLKQLRALVESAIMMIELGLVREEPNDFRDHPADIRIGDYEVRKIQKYDPNLYIFTGDLPGTKTTP